MHKDGICRVTENLYNKTITFGDINYQLAQNEDKSQIFDGYCDFLNYFDATIHVQLSFINKYGNLRDFEKAIDIPEQADDFNSIRREYSDMLKTQLSKGNNGLVKQKYITFGIEARSLREAKPKLERIEADIINNFKMLGVQAMALNGMERLTVLHGQMHPDGTEKLHFEWRSLAKSGLSTKDYIAPTSFDFRDSRTFRMGTTIGAVSYIQIIAPELTDRLLADFLNMDNAITVNLHIKSIDQSEAIKTIKRKITDLDAMKIAEQKKAVRAGYDMDVIPTDIATYGEEAKNILKELQSRNERMFLVTIIVLNTAPSKSKLENTIFAAAGIAQKYNCALKRLDFQQESGLMSSLPMGINQIEIQRGLTTSSTAIFVPFTTCELFMSGQALYYGLNALSNNLIMANRKTLKNPNGLSCKGTVIKPESTGRKAICGTDEKTPAGKRQAEEYNLMPPIPDYTLKPRKRRLTSVSYPVQSKHSIMKTKGVNSINNTTKNEVKTNRNAEQFKFSKQIGSTVYNVSAHYSKTSEETIEDKLLRLIENDVQKIA